MSSPSGGRSPPHAARSPPLRDNGEVTTIPTEPAEVTEVTSAQVKEAIDRRIADADAAVMRGADHAVWQKRVLEDLRRELFPEG